ncbi:MAG: acyl-CoA dehydrogenase family protein [Desulfarculus sp.]|nr:acyl-CoA dehydrogenase family protein [Desulfarculus sp.]
MDFNPCSKHRLVRKTVREFAETELGPIAADIDRQARFPWEVVEKMGPLHYFGLQAPRDLGGAGLDTISYAIVIEELSRVSAGLGLCVTVHNSVALYPLLRFGTPEQIKRLAPDLISGRRIGAFCLTEANAGSDASGVETLAVAQGDGYVINGTKIFVTNGGVCGLALIFAVTNPDNPRQAASVLMVEKERPGFSVGEIEELTGMRCNPVSSLFLEDCRVPAENLLGRPGQGLKIGLAALDTGRLGIAAQALGLAQAALEAALKYAKERQQFGKPIASFQTIQNYLADMATDVEASRLLLYRACAQKDAGQPFGAAAAMAKLHCSRVAREVTNLAVQIHGGCGYSQEYDVERYWREAKVTEIYEGTSEVQRMVIARDLLSRPV